MDIECWTVKDSTEGIKEGRLYADEEKLENLQAR